MGGRGSKGKSAGAGTVVLASTVSAPSYAYQDFSPDFHGHIQDTPAFWSQVLGVTGLEEQAQYKEAFSNWSSPFLGSQANYVDMRLLQWGGEAKYEQSPQRFNEKKPSVDDIQKKIENMRLFLKEMPKFPSSQPLYRKIKIPESDVNFWSQLKPGNRLRIDSMSSFSTNDKVWLGNVIFRAKGTKTGVSVRDVVEHKLEEEVIVQKNTYYRIDSVNTNAAGQTVVDITYLD